MKRRVLTKSQASTTKFAETTVDRARLTCENLKELAEAVAENERAQHQFRYAVLVRLSRIETIVQMIHGAQIVKAHSSQPGYEKRAHAHARNAESYISQHTRDLYMHMVSFIYGKEAQQVERRDGRRKWSGWEI